MLQWQGSIQDIGDLRVYGALETVDATGLFVSPARETATVAPTASAPTSRPVQKRKRR